MADLRVKSAELRNLLPNVRGLRSSAASRLCPCNSALQSQATNSALRPPAANDCAGELRIKRISPRSVPTRLGVAGSG